MIIEIITRTNHIFYILPGHDHTSIDGLKSRDVFPRSLLFGATYVKLIDVDNYQHYFTKHRYESNYCTKREGTGIVEYNKITIATKTVGRENPMLDSINLRYITLEPKPTYNLEDFLFALHEIEKNIENND